METFWTPAKRKKIEAVSIILCATSPIPLRLTATRSRSSELESLRFRAREYAALKKIKNTAPELQTDGVARREIRYRTTEAERLLYESLQESFELTNESNDCWIEGKRKTIHNITEFNSQLSKVCDRTYNLIFLRRNT